MNEDSELEAKIAALSNRIGQHRQSTYPQKTSRAHAQPQRWAPYRVPQKQPTFFQNRGVARGSTVFRNRTLVNVNSTAGSNQPAASAASDGVSTRDRGHMQWTNRSIYDKKLQEKQQAIQMTLQAKKQARDQRQVSKIINHVYGQTATNMAPNNNNSNSTVGAVAQPLREIIVNDLRFRVVLDGSKLIRVLDGPQSSVQATPKQAKVAGVTFYRSKNGNLHRAGLVKQQRNNAGKKSNKLCQAFTSTGHCSKGNRCLHIHDVNKLAICKEFLRSGNCAAGEADCNLSHSPDPHRVPACTHFLRGGCTKDECRYAHINTGASAPLCRDFGVLGYCAKGATCTSRHVMNECPDYTNTGQCSNKTCRLNHVDRAGTLRKAAAEKANSTVLDGGSDSDLSSDEGQMIDSDDVDSDDMADDVDDIRRDGFSIDPDGDEAFSGQKDFLRV